MENKEVIYCHRAFRRIYFQGKYGYILRFALLCLPFMVIVTLLSSRITFLMSTFAKDIFTYISGIYVSIEVKHATLFGRLYLVDFMGKYPSQALSAGICVCSIAGVWVLSRLKKWGINISLQKQKLIKPLRNKRQRGNYGTILHEWELAH